MTNKVRDETAADDETTLRMEIPYLFLGLCCACSVFVYSNVLVYHFTNTQLHSYGNGSVDDLYDIFDYREEDGQRINFSYSKHRFLSNPQKEVLIMELPLATFIAIMPTVTIYRILGFRRVLCICGALSIVTSALIPCTTNTGAYPLVVIIRAIQGFSLSFFLPLLAKFACYFNLEKARFFPVFVFSYQQIAAIITFPITALLCSSSLGWHAPHYIFDGCTFLLFAAFLLYHFNSKFQRQIRQGQLFRVFCGDSSRGCDHLTLQLPFLSIYQDPRVWTCLIAAFGHFCAIQLSIEFGPTFFNKVLLAGTAETGLLSAVAPIGQLLCGLIAIVVYDKLSISSTNRLRLFNSLASILPALLFFVIAFIDPEQNAAASTTLYCLGCSLLGFSAGGFLKMLHLRSRRFVVFLFAHMFGVYCFAAFISSLFHVLVEHDNEYNKWHTVLIVVACILVFCDLVFCWLASPEPAEWTKDGYEDNSIRPKRDDPLPQFPL